MRSSVMVMQTRTRLGGLLLLGIGLFSLAAQPARAQDTAAPERQIVSVVAPSSGWIGISVRVVEERGGPHRILITDVWEDSPAREAGLREGDQVLRVNGTDVSPDRFRSLTRRLEPGDPISLVVLRDGAEREVPVVAGTRPGQESIFPVRLQKELDAVRGRLDRILAEAAVDVRTDESGEMVTLHLAAPTIQVQGVAADSVITRVVLAPRAADSVETAIVSVGPRGSQEVAWVREWAEAGRERADATPVRPLAPYLTGINRVAGAQLEELGEGLASYFGVEGGLLVADVSDETPAALAGLRAGDVILEFEGGAVRTVSELRRALSQSRSGGELLVVRKGQELSIQLR